MTAAPIFRMQARVRVAQDKPKGTWREATVVARSVVTGLVGVVYDDDPRTWWLEPDRLRVINEGNPT